MLLAPLLLAPLLLPLHSQPAHALQEAVCRRSPVCFTFATISSSAPGLSQCREQISLHCQVEQPTRPGPTPSNLLGRSLHSVHRAGSWAAGCRALQTAAAAAASGVRHSISPNRSSQPALGQQLVRMEPEPEHLVAGEGAAAAGQEVGQQAWQAAPAQRCPASSLCRRLLAARCLLTEPHSLVPTLPCHPAGPALQQLWRGRAALPATPVAPPPPHRRAPVRCLLRLQQHPRRRASA